jgi:hypothetical protein
MFCRRNHHHLSVLSSSETGWLFQQTGKKEKQDQGLPQLAWNLE